MRTRAPSSGANGPIGCGQLPCLRAPLTDEETAAAGCKSDWTLSPIGLGVKGAPFRPRAEDEDSPTVATGQPDRVYRAVFPCVLRAIAVPGDFSSFYRRKVQWELDMGAKTDRKE
jgi:hypothetical protein